MLRSKKSFKITTQVSFLHPTSRSSLGFPGHIVILLAGKGISFCKSYARGNGEQKGFFSIHGQSEECLRRGFFAVKGKGTRKREKVTLRKSSWATGARNFRCCCLEVRVSPTVPRPTEKFRLQDWGAFCRILRRVHFASLRSWETQEGEEGGRRESKMEGSSRMSLLLLAKRRRRRNANLFPSDTFQTPFSLHAGKKTQPRVWLSSATSKFKTKKPSPRLLPSIEVRDTRKVFYPSLRPSLSGPPCLVGPGQRISVSRRWEEKKLCMGSGGFNNNNNSGGEVATVALLQYPITWRLFTRKKEGRNLPCPVFFACLV